VSLARKPSHIIAHDADDLRRQRIGPTPKISVSVVCRRSPPQLRYALIQLGYPPVQGAHVPHHQLGGQPSADPTRRVLGPPGAAQQLGGSIGGKPLPENGSRSGYARPRRGPPAAR